MRDLAMGRRVQAVVRRGAPVNRFFPDTLSLGYAQRGVRTLAPAVMSRLSGAGPPRLSSHFFLPLVTFLISVAALLASDSLSKPMTAEYLLPMTCATKKPKLIPASAIARAIVCPR